MVHVRVKGENDVIASVLCKYFRWVFALPSHINAEIDALEGDVTVQITAVHASNERAAKRMARDAANQLRTVLNVPLNIRLTYETLDQYEIPKGTICVRVLL